MKRGLFITFEGIDGCGKSTHIQLLSEWFTDRGADVLVLREPGGTAAGESIREILLDRRELSINSRTELLLFLAARAQICEERILPALEAGTSVICDRFSDSTLAYQGYGRGLDIEMIRQFNAFACRRLKPDVTLFLDLPREEAEKRLAARLSGRNRMDDENAQFMKRVQEGFEAIAAEEAARVFRVDSRGTKEETQARIREIIRRFIP